jgi:transcriptional regulator with XRE-family HTH domain
MSALYTPVDFVVNSRGYTAMDNFAMPRKRQPKDEGHNVFQKRLRAAMARKLTPLTNADLAKFLKVGPSTTHNWFEYGRHENIKAKDLFMLADKLEVSPRWLVGDHEDMTPGRKIDPERANVLSLYDELWKLDKEHGTSWLSEWVSDGWHTVEQMKKIPSAAVPFPRG